VGLLSTNRTLARYRAVLKRVHVWMMWSDERDRNPHWHLRASGGSLCRNRSRYVPVKAWSAAPWMAVDVVRRLYRNLLVFFP